MMLAKLKKGRNCRFVWETPWAFGETAVFF